MNELKIWSDADGGGVQQAGEAQVLSGQGITEPNYALGTFTRNGRKRQLASPDLEADRDGTRIDDKTVVVANRDGITGYEDVEVIVSSTDLLANDALGGFLGGDLSITGLVNFRHARASSTSTASSISLRKRTTRGTTRASTMPCRPAAARPGRRAWMSRCRTSRLVAGRVP